MPTFVKHSFFSMHIEAFRAHCLGKPGVTEEFPFGEFTLVFKVMGKVFALTDVQSHPLSFNVKCDPERAVQLREAYPCVTPGYHMNKRHWNTVVADGSVPDRLLIGWVDHSYDLVVAGLPKKQRAELEAGGGA
jgi:predicted DNA-binding protein (MmcQ/YjbR family)